MIFKLLFPLFLGGLCLIPMILEAQGNRVLLREITSLTLYRGEYTTGRRSSSVPQLECTGGTAHGRFAPKAVQCYNRGWDGLDVQWECKAEMPEDFQFGKIEVSCEGYDYPNDPYILAGSCGLRYELDYSSSGARKSTYYADPSKYTGPTWFSFEKIISILVILFIIYLVYLMLSSSSSNGPTTGGGSGGGWGPGYPPDGGRRPPPPGWSPPPPSYDEATGGPKPTGGPTSGSGSSGPGFYSGLGLGALGGYLFGRNTGGGEYRRRRGWGPGGSSSSYYYDDDSGGSSSYFGGGYGGSGPSTSSSSGGGGGTHSSSGFGGTSRR